LKIEYVNLHDFGFPTKSFKFLAALLVVVFKEMNENLRKMYQKTQRFKHLVDGTVTNYVSWEKPLLNLFFSGLQLSDIEDRKKRDTARSLEDPKIYTAPQVALSQPFRSTLPKLLFFAVHVLKVSP
jgi:hypothetical protein